MVDLPSLVARADAIVRDAMAADGTPGAVVAVVMPGAVHVRPYGSAAVGSAAPVTDRTAFAIGSCSKAFTAAVGAALADQGVIDLDAPVVRVIPELRLYDPWVTRAVALRDLLANRVGLSRETMLEYGSSLAARDVVRRARSVPPAQPFRSGYAYSNVGFVIAAEALARAAGSTFPALVRSLIFDELGMRDAAADFAGTLALKRLAAPHLVRRGRALEIRRLNRDNGMGSGTVYASGRDLVSWLRLHVGRGRRPVGGRRLDEVYEPATLVPREEWRFAGLPAPAFSAYALGWGIKEHGGALVHRHSGELDGFVASVALIRDRGVGVAVAANANGSLVPSAATHAILDRILDVDDRDWVAIVRSTKEAAIRAERAECAQRWGSPAPAARPAAWPSLVGRYRSPAYGRARIDSDEDGLRLEAADFPRATGRLTARRNGRFDLALSHPVEAANRGCRPWVAFEPGEPAPALTLAPYARFERMGR